MHVDDFLFGGDKDFMTLVINPLREAFVIGSEYSRAFKYLGLDLKQTKDHQILLDQNLYLTSINEIQINKDRLNLKNSPLTYEELKDYQILIGQLGWVASQTRPDLSFDVCDLSRKVKHTAVNDLLRANKVLKKAKSECVTLCLEILKSWKITK